MAAIEAPGMIARIPLIGKLCSAALPFQNCFVLGHVSYMERGQALGNHLFFATFSQLSHSEGKRTRRPRAHPTQRISRVPEIGWRRRVLCRRLLRARRAAGIVIVRVGAACIGKESTRPSLTLINNRS